MQLRAAFQTLPVGAFAAGGAGPVYPQPPAGYDIFTALGDSLMPSRNSSNFEENRDPVLDAPVADTGHWVLSSAEGDYQQVRLSTAPIWFRSAEYTGQAAGRISVMEDVLREYQDLTSDWSRGSFVVPTAIGGSALIDTGSTNDWDPATPGTHLVNAKNNHNSAYAAVRAIEAGSRVRAVVIDLTTNDVNGGDYNSTNIRAAWLGLIDYVRANFDGVDDETPIIIGGPAAAGSGHNTARADVEYAATQRDNVHVVHPVFPTADPSNLHPERTENRTWGTNIAAAIYAAPEPATVEDFSIAPVNGAALDSDIDSDPVLVMVGYGEGVTASITGGTFSVDGGAFSATSRTVYWGNEIVVRVHSSDENGTTETAELTIGTKSAEFNVTTPTPAMHVLEPGNLVIADGELIAGASDLYLEAA